MSDPSADECNLDQTIKWVASGIPIIPLPMSPNPIIAAGNAVVNNHSQISLQLLPMDLSMTTGIQISDSITMSSGSRTPPVPMNKASEDLMPKEEPMEILESNTTVESAVTATTIISTSQISEGMETDQSGVKPQLYCICRSKSSDEALMVGCDNCNDWFHFACVKVTKSQCNNIVLYYCPPCIEKNPLLEIVYKKKSVRETEREGSTPVTVIPANELRCGQCIGCFRVEKFEDCQKCDGCLKNEGCAQKKCVQADVLRKQQKDKERRSNQRLAGGGNRPKREHKPIVKVEEEEVVKPTTSQLVVVAVDKKRRGRKKGWRKDRGTEDDDDDYVEEKGKFDPIELNNRMMAEAYDSFSRRSAKTSSKSRVKAQSPVQCLESNNILIHSFLGPGCVLSAHPPSKYCSDECGMRLAEARLDNLLPERVRDYWGNLPVAYKRAVEQGRKIDKQMVECRATNDKLLERMSRVMRFVEVMKKMIPVADTEDDSENMDAVVMVACPVCTLEQSSRSLAKHVERCFVKSEKQTTFGTSTKLPINPSNLFCEAHNKANDTYCKRLRVMCAEHYKGELEAEMNICGFPTAWTDAASNSRTFKQAFEVFDDVESMANYCQLSRKECLSHHRWIQTTLGILECERMNVLTKIDELWERRRAIVATLQTRGDLITLLSNKTTPATLNVLTNGTLTTASSVDGVSEKASSQCIDRKRKESVQSAFDENEVYVMQSHDV